MFKNKVFPLHQCQTNSEGEKRLKALSEAEGRCVVGIWHVATCLVDEEWEQRGMNAWFKVPKLRPVSGN